MRYTRELASNWLGDRGLPTLKTDIKLYGRWALVRTPDGGELGWDSEVDCYHIDPENIYAEPWECIKYTDSPFVLRNQTKTDKAMAKVESSYLEEFPEEQYQPTQLCLVAVSGDCSAGAMSKENSVLLFDAKHNNLVKEYLIADLKFWMYSATEGVLCGNVTKGDQTYYHRLVDAETALREVGIFKHKYHTRTSWRLEFLNEVLENDNPQYKPCGIDNSEYSPLGH